MAVNDWEELKELFIAYQLGDSDAVRPFFDSLKGRIEQTLRGRSLNAEDVNELTQQALLRVHLSRDRFDAALPLKAWVVTIVQRTLIDFWRKNGRMNFSDITELEIPSSETSWFGMSPESVLNLKHVDQLIEKLKPLDRRIVNMFAFDNKSIDSIGSELKITPMAVKLRLHRARQYMKTLGPIFLVILWRSI